MPGKQKGGKSVIIVINTVTIIITIFLNQFTTFKKGLSGKTAIPPTFHKVVLVDCLREICSAVICWRGNLISKMCPY